MTEYQTGLDLSLSIPELANHLSISQQALRKRFSRNNKSIVAYKTSLEEKGVNHWAPSRYVKTSEISGATTGHGNYNRKNASKALSVWRGMIARCYYESATNYKHYGLKGTTVCDEWKDFQNFAPWFNDNHVEGFQLDKDKLQEGVANKVYSPSTCVFLSPKDNVDLINFQDKVHITDSRHEYILTTGIEEGLPLKDLAIHFGVTKSYLYQGLVRLGITTHEYRAML